ncbi:PQQ-binding-like beta-propeller repeat protein [Alphaproteobacteria bacterium]|nr:PQQ-binding-like beta-propeller repeat protein [Alphaproteobacteria bacterium]
MTAEKTLMNGRTLLSQLSLVLGKSLSAGFVMLALSACSKSELILDGDRVAIITTSDVIAADPAALAEGAGLPGAIDILNAGHPGLSAGHTGGNVRASLPFKRAWRASIGGSGDSLTELAQPMVAGEQVFTVAPNGTVTAFDIKNGKANWQVSVEEFTDDPLPGIAGGLAVRGETLFVHAGGRSLAALSVHDGSAIWSILLRFPVRGGPTIIGQEAVAVTDLDGNIFVYSVNDGSLVWERAGLPVNTVVYGAPSPAFANDQLAVAGYGGDISLLEANTGQIIWSDTLAAFSPRTPLQRLGDIRAHPVFDGGLVFAVSQAGKIVAFNARSGLLIWDQPIGGIEMPWVAGKSLFLQTIDGRLYALRRSDGLARWIAELPGALPKGVITSEENPRYVGPVVVDGKVMVISKSGSLFVFDANTGDGGKTIDVGTDVVTSPQLASGMMFVLSGNGTLTAFD